MTVKDRLELQAALVDAVDRFGWWEVLWECSNALRDKWEDSPANDGKKKKKLATAAYHVEQAADAVNE